MTVLTSAARTQTIAFLSSGAKEANDALERLTALYGNSPLDKAEVIVALGRHPRHPTHHLRHRGQMGRGPRSRGGVTGSGWRWI